MVYLIIHSEKNEIIKRQIHFGFLWPDVWSLMSLFSWFFVPFLSCISVILEYCSSLIFMPTFGKFTITCSHSVHLLACSDWQPRNSHLKCVRFSSLWKVKLNSFSSSLHKVLNFNKSTGLAVVPAFCLCKST